MSIPKNIFDQIVQMKASSLQKDILFREAYLREEMIRNYDKPEKRKTMRQEMLYLEECQKESQLYANGEFYHNFKRKLANRSIMTQYYGLKNEFLPKELEAYCEHNITKMKLHTFVPKKEKQKKPKVKKAEVKLENLSTFLEKYKGDPKKKKYAEEYLSLMKHELQKDSTPTPSLESLKLLRLRNCLVGDNDKEDLSLIMARVKDFRIEGIKERFYSNIFNSQRWWSTTIRLKMDSEGKSKEMKMFFDCSKVYERSVFGNKAQNSFRKPTNKYQREKQKKEREEKQKISMAGSQKRELLKYYCGTFEGKPTPDLTNKKAIASGMIPKKFISSNGTVTPLIGKELIFKGMPKGGMKLTYSGLKKGAECEGILSFINMDETIFFGGKSYTGLDFVTINGTKIMLDNFSDAYVQKLCNEHALNDVSFVMENTVSKYQYNQVKPAVSLYGKTKGEFVPIQVPKGFTNVINTHVESSAFFLVGDKAYLVNKQINTPTVVRLPNKFDNALKGVVSRDANLIFARSHMYNMKTKELQKILLARYSQPQLFLNDNKVMVLFEEKKISFLDLSSQQIISEFQPKFIEPNKKYFTPRLKRVVASKNSEALYVMSDKGEVEYWRLSGKKDALEYEYKAKVETNGELVSTILLNPYNENQLIYATHKNKIDIVESKTGKRMMTLKADRRMMAEGIDISSDQKYLIAYDHHFIYVWSLEEGTLLDVIGSKQSKLYGAMFAKDDPARIIRVSTEVEVWTVLEKEKSNL